MAHKVIFLEITQSEYDSLSVKDTHTIYWTTDTRRIYKGTDRYDQSDADNSTLEINGSGNIAVKDNGITGTKVLNNTISNSKLAQMPATTIKGNATSGTANTADLTIAQVADLISPLLPEATNITISEVDLTAGSSTLPTGSVYLVYE
jgi:hypothetical protein